MFSLSKSTATTSDAVEILNKKHILAVDQENMSSNGSVVAFLTTEAKAKL